MTDGRGDRLVVASFPEAKHAADGARLTAEARLSDLHFAVDPATGRPALWLLGWDARGRALEAVRPLEPAVATRLLGELSALMGAQVQASGVREIVQAEAPAVEARAPGDLFAARRTGRDNA
jgi:hypothetical protein